MSLVRKTSEKVMELANNVKINEEILERIGQSLREVKAEPQSWESFPYHYKGPNEISYIFTLDTLNFCFWPDESFEYESLAYNLKQLIQADENALSPYALSTISQEQVQEKIFKNADLPLLEERTRLLQELGNNVMKHFEGEFYKIVEKSNHSVEEVKNI